MHLKNVWKKESNRKRADDFCNVNRIKISIAPQFGIEASHFYEILLDVVLFRWMLQ